MMISLRDQLQMESTTLSLAFSQNWNTIAGLQLALTTLLKDRR